MRFFVLFCLLALQLSCVAEAQVSTCGPGRTCNAAAYWSRSAVSNTNDMLCLQNPTNAVSLYRATQMFRIGVEPTCGAAVSAVPFEIDTTGAVINLGYPVSMNGAATVVAFPAPTSVRGFWAETATQRVWKSDVSKWTEIGSGTHPGLEKPTYFYVSDTTAGANAPAWAVAPRAGGASVAFTSAGTLANNTTLSCSTAAGPCSSTAFSNYQTTAVSGNQSHHSTAVFTGSAFRWAATVSVPTLTSVRFFAGMSNTLPLLAGSSTPTAHAAVFRYDSGIGANIFACTGAGAAVSCVDTGVAAVGGFDLAHRLAIDCREASVGTTTRCFFWVDGIARVAVTTTLPAARLGSTISSETLTAAARSFSFSTVSVEPL